MAHLVENMAFVGQTPWHGLGNKLEEDQPLEVWLKQAGMDWNINETEVLFKAEGPGFNIQSNRDAKVLYRSDSLEALSVVSNRYKVVQPREVLEFYRDLVDVGGFKLESAGVLKGGRKLWALARTGQETLLKGGDRVKGYLLLATACDGTLATTAQFTSVRVVCNNTLQMAVGDSNGAIKVPHSTTFDSIQVKQSLGLGMSSWDAFMVSIKALSERKVHRIEAMNYLVDVLGDPEIPLANQSNEKAISTTLGLFNGKGKGSDLAAANDTAWGLLNAVTEFVDHHKTARSTDNRLNSAWFGQGAAIKEKAFERAMQLVA